MESNIEVTVSPAALTKISSGSISTQYLQDGGIVLMAGRTRRIVRAAELLDDDDVGNKGDGGAGKRRACETLQVGVSGFVPCPEFDVDVIKSVAAELAPIRILGMAFIRDGLYVRQETYSPNAFHKGRPTSKNKLR